MTTTIRHHAAKHHAKIAKVTTRSRIWLEIVTCAGTAYETRLLLLSVASIAWVIVDVICIVLGEVD